jgi:hypothetical protein
MKGELEMKVVVQQALFHHFVQPVGMIANLAAINPRTAWNHIHAAQKSHVKPWDNRPAAEQDAAIKEAEKIVKGNRIVSNSIVPQRGQSVRTRRARIPAVILHAMIDTEISKQIQANATFTAYSITLLIRAMNPSNEIAHNEVQARVRYVMIGYSNYELVFQTWSGKSARTWRPMQAPTAMPVQFGVQPQAAWLTAGIKIVDDD